MLVVVCVSITMCVGFVSFIMSGGGFVSFIEVCIIHIVCDINDFECIVGLLINYYLCYTYLL